MSKQINIAILYLDHLTNGHMLLGMQVRLRTLKGYMNIMAKLVEIHVGRDIRFHPPVLSLDTLESQWEHHFILDTIYKDPKS